LKKLKIGFLINGNFVDKYNYELAKWIKKNNKKFISSVFISIPQNKKNKKLFKRIFFKFLIFFEFSLLKIFNKHNNHLTKFDLRKVIKKKIELRNTINNNKDFTKNDLQKIKNEKFDILIRANSSFLKGEILRCSKYGIISFHHGDYEKYRGAPAGFWEVFYREENTGFLIQKLNENLDYGKIIFKGFFQTKSFFLYNQAELFEKSIFYFKKVLLDFHQNRKFNFIKKRKKGKIYETPRIFNQIKYIFQTINLLINKFLKKDDFSIALFNSKKINTSIIIKNNLRKFLADPFLVNYENRTFCFAEEFDYIKKKGNIVCIDLKNQNKKIVLDEKFHLSFPYIFNYKNKLFMCPDTSEISEIRLYQCINFPLDWKFYKTIKKDITAVDSILFKKNNLWWLFTNIDRSLTGDFTHDLSIYYSKNGPLTNKWFEHPLNPIKMNSSESRNGGLIFDKNKIIRISQKQGFDNYGEEIYFQQIKTLTTKKYVEKKIQNKEFNKIKKILINKDIHHISKLDNKIVVDFK